MNSHIRTYVIYVIAFTYVCFTGPPALNVNITNLNTENSSIIVQWIAVDHILPTTYTVTWTDDRDLFEAATVDEQTSYTITGLTLDTVYTITITPSNRCGSGQEFSSLLAYSVNPTIDTSTTTITIATTTSDVTAIFTTTTTNVVTTPSSSITVSSPTNSATILIGEPNSKIKK